MTDPVHAALLALALSYAGMACLCFAMDRHYGQLTQRHGVPKAQAGLLRGAGAALLGAACWSCLPAFGASVGTVVWLGLMSAAALALTMALHASPRLAAGAAWLCLGGAGWVMR